MVSGYKMLKTREREKLINALIYFSQNVINPSKTKIFKLLNYLDFLHFEKTGKSVTGLKYFAWDRGPVPEELYNEWKAPQKDFNLHLKKAKKAFQNGWVSEYLEPRKKFDAKFFSPFELRLMENLAKKHFRDNADQMSEKTHFQTGPWDEVYNVQKTPSAEIPYELTLLRRGSDEDLDVLALSKEYKEIRDNIR